MDEKKLLKDDELKNVTGGAAIAFVVAEYKKQELDPEPEPITIYKNNPAELLNIDRLIETDERIN